VGESGGKDLRLTAVRLKSSRGGDERSNRREEKIERKKNLRRPIGVNIRCCRGKPDRGRGREHGIVSVVCQSLETQGVEVAKEVGESKKKGR